MIERLKILLKAVQLAFTKRPGLVFGSVGLPLIATGALFVINVVLGFTVLAALFTAHAFSQVFLEMTNQEYKSLIGFTPHELMEKTLAQTVQQQKEGKKPQNSGDGKEPEFVNFADTTKKQ
mgnify:CR=1 FL=1